MEHIQTYGKPLGTPSQNKYPQSDTYGSRGPTYGTYTGTYTGTYSDDDSSFDSSSDAESYSGSSDSRSPVIGIGKSISPKKTEPRELFPDESSDTSSVQGRDKKPRKSIYIIVIVLLLVGYLLISSTQPITTIPTPTPRILPPPPVDWWNEYNINCCILNNSSNIYRNTDCSADGNCHIYLVNWLIDNNQSFNNSPWSHRCCYEYRPFGAENYQKFCSYTCLNTEKTQHRIIH